MGFSIGSFLSSVAGPIIGGIFGGPIGAAIGAGVSAGFSPGGSPPGRNLTPPRAPVQIATATVPKVAVSIPFSRAPVRFRGPTSLQGATGRDPIVSRGGFQTASVGALTRGAIGAGIVEGALSIFNRTGSELSEILAEARSNVRGATKSKIIAAAKACGLEVAAATYGLDLTDVCRVVVAGRTRRRRGVSAADIRRTKRTLRFVSSLRKDLKKVKL